MKDTGKDEEKKGMEGMKDVEVIEDSRTQGDISIDLIEGQRDHGGHQIHEEHQRPGRRCGYSWQGGDVGHGKHAKKLFCQHMISERINVSVLIIFFCFFGDTSVKIET